MLTLQAIKLVIQFFILALLSPTNGFYLPGVVPRDFKMGDVLPIKVNKLSSSKTWLPYDYYSLAYCKPEELLHKPENIGEVLRGEKIQNSAYEVHMKGDGETEQCRALCAPITLDETTIQQFKDMIDDDYQVNMILDNLPLGRPDTDQNSNVTRYTIGFPVGRKDRDGDNHRYYLYNHIKFIIKYHISNTLEQSNRVVAFELGSPSSIQHQVDAENWKDSELSTCAKPEQEMELTEGAQLLFTYETSFEQSPVRWASRWDAYLYMVDDKIHWFSIINSLMIVLFLTGMVAMIMLRTVHTDIARYNAFETAAEAQEETGWKLVHGDVFRVPPYAGLLSTYVGTGVQILGCSVVTLVFAALGFLSPAVRGGFMTAALSLYVVMGFIGGYAAGQMYRLFKGTNWANVTLQTAVFFPGTVFVVFFIINLFIWHTGSTGAVSFKYLVFLCVLWFGVSLPLVFLGAYYGFRQKNIDPPVRVNKIPRQIPVQPFYMNVVVSCLIGGVLPFGAVFIELFFILTSVWKHEVYYIFGFLFLVLIILIITCAETTVVLCYFQLCSENYNWWWRSYFTSGSSALYLWCYSCFYFQTRLESDKFVPIVVYFGYMILASYGFFCLTGTIGFLACLKFVRAIYSAIKTG